MLVKNEANWIYFAIKSVLPFVQELIIFDTGSTDKTLDIINTFSSPKIRLYQKPAKSRNQIVSLRQEMVTLTSTDWFLLVDGDEVWSNSSIKTLIKALALADKQKLGAVVRFRNLVGDLYHYQPESAGQYHLLGRRGHLSTRAFRRHPDYAWIGDYPLESYSNQKTGISLHDEPNKLLFINTYYYHLTHLKRSTDIHSAQVIDRPKKYKLEIGLKADKSQIPEVFFEHRPDIIPDPFVTFTFPEKIKAHFLTPLRLLKRKFTH